jgi:hypothetical protein
MLRLYVLKLKRDLDIIYSPYNIKPNIKDVKLLGLIKAQNRQVNTLARIVINIILRDNALKKGL